MKYINCNNLIKNKDNTISNEKYNVNDLSKSYYNDNISISSNVQNDIIKQENDKNLNFTNSLNNMNKIK